MKEADWAHILLSTKARITLIKRLKKTFGNIVMI